MPPSAVLGEPDGQLLRADDRCESTAEGQKSKNLSLPMAAFEKHKGRGSSKLSIRRAGWANSFIFCLAIYQ